MIEKTEKKERREIEDKDKREREREEREGERGREWRRVLGTSENRNPLQKDNKVEEQSHCGLRNK